MHKSLADHFTWCPQKEKWCPKQESMLPRDNLSKDPSASSFKKAFEATGCGFIELPDMDQDGFIEYIIQYLVGNAVQKLKIDG